MEQEEIPEEEAINRLIRRKTIFSLSVLFAAFALDVFAWKWLRRQAQEHEQPWPLRRTLEMNAKVNSAFFSMNHLAREYSKSEAATNVRLNGHLGLSPDYAESQGLLKVMNSNAKPKEFIHIEIEGIKALPKRDLIFKFKCIEGWSQISHWGGATFIDFIKKYHLGTRSGNVPDPENRPEDLYKYVGLATPDQGYYVGIDMKSMIHPQTILCYEMNEKPLPLDHGFPLRLIIPVKYGIKNLKGIGSISFSDSPPPDYWYERGYDYDVML